MATYDLQGQWNMRIKGIKVDTLEIPIIEIYFNLGHELLANDILTFGTYPNFGRDMQIRLNTIGDSWYFCGSTNIKKPTDVNPFTNIDVSSDSLRFWQQTGNSNSSISASSRILYGLRILGSSYPSPGFVSAEVESFSPIIVLHDEFTDKLILHDTQSLSVCFYSTVPGLVRNVDNLPSTNNIPVVGNMPKGEATTTIKGFIDNILEVVNPSDSDPYNPNGEPAGGGGEIQNTDEMADETLPTISAVDTGFVTLYKPSLSQMNALASYMWGQLDIDTFKKIFANPMDVILGLSILPGIVPAGGSSSVMVGNINTGVSMTKVGNQYVKYDCGSVSIKKQWGAFLDYSPYTKAFIYLPFIGIHPIDVDEIMGKTVSVTYNIDVLSGGCCAFIKVNGTTLYSYIGQCACSVPVTGKDWSTMINGVLGAVSGIAGTIGSIASGNVAGAVSGVAAVAQNVAGAKPSYQRSGTMGGMGGMMGIKTPYIIIERPVQAVPGYQNRMIGYPSFVTRLISDFKGYTEFEQVHLENVPCSQDELDEIETILKSGVIL